MADEDFKVFPLRIPLSLHSDLVLMAKDNDRSLHNLILVLLKAAAVCWRVAHKVAA